MNPVWNLLRFHVIPILFIFGCPTSIFFLTSKFHRDNDINSSFRFFKTENLLGNSTSWTILTIFTTWAFLSLKIPSKKYKGPTTSFGFTPIYQDNGFAYYITTTTLFFILCYFFPTISSTIYTNFPQIMFSTNLLAIFLCVYLHFKGKKFPETKEKLEKNSLIFEFYRGMEVHPTIFNVDVKQFTNCRFGLMSWQLLIISYFFVSFNQTGFNPGLTSSVILQTVYLCKFFWWEKGYFDTIDITLDRAGFYICWGCLQFLPGFYAFPAYFFVKEPPKISPLLAALFLVLGLTAILFTYLTDHEKEIFKASNGKRGLWSRNVSFVETEYQTDKGRKKGKLLTSGLWGISRHLNYVFELVAYYSWSAPGIYSGVWSFSNAIFLTVLLVHRTFRDEEKCANKYGKSWEKYCKTIKYRMIPYIF